MLALGRALGTRHDDDLAAQARAAVRRRAPRRGAADGPPRHGVHRSSAAPRRSSRAAIDDGLRASASDALRRLAARLRAAFAPVADRPETGRGPSPSSPTRTPLLPRALIVAGQRDGDRGAHRDGPARARLADRRPDVERRRVLADRQRWVLAAGRPARPLRPAADRSDRDDPGRRGRPRRRRANRATSTRSSCAYGWFLGDNDIGLPMADPTHGRAASTASSRPA